MRSAKRQLSALESPLDRVLGTDVNVRILRLLVLTGEPMSKAAIAKRTYLNASGVGRSIDELAEQGVVEPVGTGSRRLYRLRRAYPLWESLTGLFDAEHSRFVALLDDLRTAADCLVPPPRAVWIQGSTTRESGKPGDQVTVGILASARDIDRLVQQLREAVREVEASHDVDIPVHGLTEADYAAQEEQIRAELKTARPLFGPSPLSLINAASQRRRSPPDHQELDRRALALAAAVAERLAQDPSMIDRAIDFVERRLQRGSPTERADLEEWRHILRRMPPARLRKFLVDPSERAMRLRQSLPFAGELSKSELAAARERAREKG